MKLGAIYSYSATLQTLCPFVVCLFVFDCFEQNWDYLFFYYVCQFPYLSITSLLWTVCPCFVQAVSLISLLEKGKETSADLWHVDEHDEEPDVGEDGEQSGHAEHGKVLDSEKWKRKVH